MARPRLLLAAALLAIGPIATGCGEDAPVASDPLTGTQLDPPFQVDGAELEDTDGDPYSLTGSTDRRLTMVFFGYTNCPDVCPAVMGNLASAMTRLDPADRKQVDVVFVTTDPARDTPDALRAYLDRYDPSFIGVTGPLDQIAAVAKSVAVGMGTELPSGGYEVEAHTTQVTGIDVDDEAPIYWGASTSSQQFAQDIHTLLGG